MASSSSSHQPHEQATFRGFSPPAFIFSYDQQHPYEQIVQAAAHFAPMPVAAEPARRSGLGAARIDSRDAGTGDGEDDRFTPYGPTLRRMGNVRFVKAKLGDQPQVTVEGKGKARAVGQQESTTQSKGQTVSSLYQSIVGNLSTTPARTPPGRPTPPPPDVDLTLDDDSDDTSEDDCVVLDPSTGLPAPPPPPPPPRMKRLRPKRRAIHDLLPADLTTPHVPPVHYTIKPNSIGWRILAKSGWVEGQPLGPVQDEGEAASARGKRLKVPLQGVEKFDRRGLGGEVGKGHGPKRTKEEREQERRRVELVEKERRGRGARGMSKQREWDVRERKEMIAYMNR